MIWTALTLGGDGVVPLWREKYSQLASINAERRSRVSEGRGRLSLTLWAEREVLAAALYRDSLLLPGHVEQS